jgi:hypothetical protein
MKKAEENLMNGLRGTMVGESGGYERNFDSAAPSRKLEDCTMLPTPGCPPGQYRVPLGYGALFSCKQHKVFRSKTTTTSTVGVSNPGGPWTDE